jgi:hypothetical protein
MRDVEPICSRESGSCPLILKPNPTADMKGRFCSFNHQGSWMQEWGNLPKGERSKHPRERLQVMAMGYIEGGAKIKGG